MTRYTNSTESNIHPDQKTAYDWRQLLDVPARGVAKVKESQRKYVLIKKV